MKIQARDVSYGVGEQLLVNSISLVVPSGTMTAIIGPNGAGKSMLLHLLAGDIDPSSGSLWYDGESLSSISLERRARLRSVLDASREPDIAFTVDQVVAMGRFPHRFDARTRGDTDSEAVESAIEDLDLDTLRGRQVRALSGGEQQRVAIARVLAQRSQLVLLDEPTTALDIGHQAAVMALIEHLRTQGRTVVAVLHDLNMATSFDNVVLLQSGAIVASGGPSEVLTSVDLTRAYGHQIDVAEHPHRGGLLILPRPVEPPRRSEPTV
jgi:iron complex transport system ATP-binding protein